MDLPAKSLIRASFNRAAAEYDNAAVVQRTICQHLARDLVSYAPFLPENPCRVLDAGCGTGYGLSVLQQTLAAGSEFVALDFAPAMLQRLPKSLVLTEPLTAPLAAIAGDMENLPLATASLGLYWSSLAVQWCDFRQVMHEAARVLQTGGVLAVSTLGQATFHELRFAFAAVDSYRHTLSFSESNACTNALQAEGFHTIQLQRETLTLYYPELKTLLQAVKSIGANRVGHGQRNGMMGKAAWQAVNQRYESLRTAEGLPLSYDVLYCYAQKG